jgi:uncharacterized membrane protein YkoI
MHPTRKVGIAAFVLGSVVTGALGFNSFSTASAASPAATVAVAVADDSSTSTAAIDAAVDAPHAANGITEEALTGDTASSVEAAVTAAYPDATIDRLETDADGATYEAHITLADGSQATVKLDAEFAITGTETGGSRHHGGKDGAPHTANGITEEALTGDTAAGVEAAVAAAYPDATINRMETDADGAAYEAHITLADGSDSTVQLDASFAITATGSAIG